MRSNDTARTLAEALDNLATRLDPESGDMLSGTFMDNDLDLIEEAADALRATMLDSRACIQIPGRKGKHTNLVLRAGVTVEDVATMLAGVVVTGPTGKLKDANPYCFAIPNGNYLLNQVVDYEARIATPRSEPIHLSAGAIAGILRRAAKHGGGLPAHVEEALRQAIETPGQLAARVDARLVPVVQAEEEGDIVAGEMEQARCDNPPLTEEAMQARSNAYAAGGVAFGNGVSRDDSPFLGVLGERWREGWDWAKNENDRQSQFEREARPGVLALLDKANLEGDPQYKQAALGLAFQEGQAAFHRGEPRGDVSTQGGPYFGEAGESWKQGWDAANHTLDESDQRERERDAEESPALSEGAESYEAGRLAHSHGASLQDCPFQGVCGNRWRDGWKAAESEDNPL